MTDASTPLTSRRSVLAAAGAVSLATTLTACSDSGNDSGYVDSGSADQQSGQSGQEQSDEAGGGDGGQELAQASDIPEGGGTVFKDQKVVVTQPNPGEYKAFSAVCTHQGCLVSSVADGAIVCSCHNSRFSIADGSVQGGPATQPLAQANVSVEGGSVRLG
ncbi:Rieske (2Fe-2S) protein [Streptomyces sp. TRM 70361]|uniref:Rieske (2Fe-2S) protein n=1 Tax=Streptomyces sp. TRM 70361 TaxID=3116553 RepID=UPI002E7ADBA4|nr:Rieske (2Fe-2S) protein [Streptomyces sp. TRM 70361]MEE1942032.1 Rieske (2Fe-2S) protein [Streptomyces sp. TRM 70361]